MRAASLAAAALMACAGVAEARALRAVEFRDRMASAVATATGQPTTVVDERTFKGRRGDGEELTFFIDNAYAEYLADPTRLDAILQRFATVVPRTGAVAASMDQLVVIVRPTGYLAQVLPAGASLDQFVPPRPMAGDLSFFLAVDSPDAIRTAGKDDLKRWGLDESAAWARAMANIKPRVGALTMFRLSDREGASGLGAESGLAPSVLADPAFCGPANPNGMAGQVVLVLGRDKFLFAPPGDRVLTDRFWKAVRQEVGAQRSLSRTPLTCRGGRWVVAAKP